jgi:deoxyhypusine synthase
MDMSLFAKKIEGITVEEKTISQLLLEMGKTAYQGRTLSEAVDLWQVMAQEKDLTIILGLAGSLSTAGQWPIINWLIENRLIDVIVSTGANISEDIVDAMGLGYWQATIKIDDKTLLQEDINRYYDVYGKESDYRKMEELITEFLLTLKTNFHYSSMELLHLLGKWLHKKRIKSITSVAAEYNVPIFSPALLDSAYGETVLMAKNLGHNLIIDQVKEFYQFVGIGEKTKNTGVIYIGGGVPKDFTQLLAISISPKTNDQKIKGRKGHLRKSVKEYYYPHKYAIQITTDSPQWGGLSGCTLEEATSWGKISENGNHVTCYCDATIALPIITHALNERIGLKRKANDLSWMFNQINNHINLDKFAEINQKK